MAVTKQEGTVDLWAMGDYVPHWVFKCEKGHQAEVPADAGAREAHHERLLQQLERGVCPYCQASWSGMTTVDHDLWHEVHQFLLREARLLDERRFEEWLELFTGDVVYWMPERVNPPAKSSFAETISKPGELALFEETKETLSRRVARLGTGMAWGEEPASRTRHLITNVEVEPGRTDGELQVHSNFMLYRSQLEHDQDIFVGCRDDVLRRVDGAWKIARRTILLDQAVLSAKNLSVFF